jgi:tryptophan synthase alpha chain
MNSMNQSLQATFAKRGGHAALVTYIMAGDPDLETSANVALALQAAGADVIELGVPFSDPIADGPVIQAAGQRALDQGVTLRKVLAQVQDLRKRGLGIPVVLMGYINPIMKLGFAAFADACAQAGVSGVIVPDLPVDEAVELDGELSRAGVDAIQLVAPTSSDDRIRFVAARSRGFLYYVSLTGVTGVRDSLPSDVVERIRKVQSLSPVPVAVGFGVSNAEMARGLGKVAPGVVVGSAIVKLVETHGRAAAGPVGELVGKLRKALDEVELAAG